MDKIVEFYRVVTSADPNDLAGEVGDMIREGYQPFGAVAVCPHLGSLKFYAQAMVKYKRPD